MKSFLIGAATSNSGKTTLTMGLLRALKNRGFNVQPYKCGPDYIDPMFHSLASGTESVNLDTWMAGEEGVKAAFNYYGNTADVKVVEGVMGLYDGYDKWHGSSGEIAMMLDIPVILVVNAKSVAYSVAPLIYGFKNYSPLTPEGGSLRVKGNNNNSIEKPIKGSDPLIGEFDRINAKEILTESSVPEVAPFGGRGALAVIFNMVASESHYKFLKEACEDAGVPCLGYLSKNAELNIPGRHLGLTISAKEEMEKLISLAAEEVEKHVDMDTLCAFVGISNSNEEGNQNSSHSEQNNNNNSVEKRIKGSDPLIHKFDRINGRIAIARDEAFNFVYRHNIDALRGMGDVTFFSPLRDKEFPECDFLYLPGGYPELFAKELTENESMRQSIKDFAERGGRIYAECGGFMYLCKDIDGQPMCDVLPLQATMEGAKLHLGYRTMEYEGKTYRGHEFHYSSIKPIEKMPDSITVEHCQYSAKGAPVDTAIYKYKNVVAGYTHWYFTI